MGCGGLSVCVVCSDVGEWRWVWFCGFCCGGGVVGGDREYLFGYVFFLEDGVVGV